MKILLDTSYFLPLIGFKISNVEEDFLLRLLEQNEKYQLLYSTISVFELQAKGAKEVEKGNMDNQRIITGAQSLCNDEDLIEIPFTHSTLITQLSIELRKHNTDFIDCLILSTAMLTADILITEDKWIKEFIETDFYQGLILNYELSEKFRVVSSKDFWTNIRS